MAAIGFIGLGIMGGGMARNLAHAGHTVKGWSRSKPSQDLAGVTLAGSIAEAASGAEIVIISVTGPEAQHAVIGGDDGLLAHVARGVLVLDATTTDSELSAHFHKEFAARGAVYADMPVFGSKNEAWEGKLDVMFGGTGADFARARPLMEAIGKTVTHVGPAGTAICLKLVGNTIVAAEFMALAEGMAMAKRCGINPETLAHMLDVTDFGSGLLQNNARSAAKGDYSAFFQLKDMLKDCQLAGALARRTGVPAPATALAAAAFEAARNTGHGGENVSALVAYVEAQSRQ